MSNSKPYVHSNVYHNTMSEATPSAFMPNADTIDKAFIEEANRVLSTAVELMHVLIGAHQSAVSIIVQCDWRAVHKFFSRGEVCKMGRLSHGSG